MNDFSSEELKIGRALATQAALAIQLTQLAKAARHSAVLEERSRLAGEIHDSLAHGFAGISMQLETVVTVTLRWDAPNLILQVKDNGSAILKARLEQGEGLGLESMRERAAQIDAKLEIQTAAGRGTNIIVTVPISS